MGEKTKNTTSSIISRFLINRNFLYLWGGQAISNFGDTIFYATLTLWVATVIARNQSWAPLASSGIFIMVALPALLIGPIAGVFVDRWDKRRIMLFADAIRAFLILILLFLVEITPLSIWKIVEIYLITILTNICAQFFEPARFAILVDVVEQEQRIKASGLEQAVQSAAVIVGPFISAPLFVIFGIQWALALNAVSFLVSYLAILTIHPPEKAVHSKEQTTITTKTSFWQEFQEGLHFILHSRLIIALVVSVGIVNFGGAAFENLYVYFALDNLHLSISLYGTFGMIAGIGAILGTSVTIFFTKRLGEIRIFWLSFVITGIFILILARQTQFYLALVIYFLMSSSFVAVNIVVGPLLQRTIPHHMLGRVKGILTQSMYLIMMVSTFFFGYLATLLRGHWQVNLGIVTFGPIDTIFTVTGLIVIIGGIYTRQTVHEDAS